MKYDCGEELIGDYTSDEVFDHLAAKYLSRFNVESYWHYWEYGLGRVPDQVAATALGVSKWSVRARRQLLRLPACLPCQLPESPPALARTTAATPHEWMAWMDDEGWLQLDWSQSNLHLARQLGTTWQAIADRRRRLRMKYPDLVPVLKPFGSRRAAGGEGHGVMVSVLGVTLSLVAWSHRQGIPYVTIANRIRRGWDPVAAVTCPMGYSKHEGRWRKNLRP